MEKCAEGIYIAGRYGNPSCATWLFEHNGECAIVEMPPFLKREGRPIELIKEFIANRNLIGPKYIFCSHAHMDHTYSIFHYKKAFSNAKIVVSNTFYNDYFIRYFLYMYWTKNRRIYGDEIAENMNLFDEVFTSELYKLDIGGEPVYLINAPKHSYEDTIIVFKGAMITGDWAIGPYPDCNDIVSPQDKIQSIERLTNIIRNINYNIHMLFSVHGDNLMYNTDFYGIMRETLDYCYKEAIEINPSIPIIRINN
jgi:glyoxylase-like metal-dependent hydrolase (beta-lactamase superfamily II)